MKSAIEAHRQFVRDILARWENLIQSTFPISIPNRCRWDDADDIVSVLATIGGAELTNHIFLPHGGGVDLTGADSSAEKGCVEMHYGQSAMIARPSALFFESFGKTRLEWAYFRLETQSLEPSGTYEHHAFDTHEEVTDLGSGDYRPRSIWDQGYLGYDDEGAEIPLPDNARPLFRIFKGAFVIFAKGSPYNADHDTYDARHDKLNGEQFRVFIQRNLDLFEEARAARGSL
ncbi:MAG: hypothetical protein QOE77_1754 [Blastocatellia bacterium]|jgi:serine/threonine-protein kinase|nr:hypothetical protein [Blastocatellia bacterium]